MKFNENLHLLRKRQKKTQTEIAEELQVSQRVISNWEKGTNKPDLDSILKIAKYFQVSTDFLLGYSIEDTITEEKIQEEKE